MILACLGESTWLVYFSEKKKFYSFKPKKGLEGEEVKMEVKIKGSKVFKQKYDENLKQILAHPDWFGEENNYALVMNHDDSVTLVKCVLEKGVSG